MSAKLLDADLILSGNEQWMKLDQDWKAIDLETEEEPAKLSPVFSTLDLRKSTFDSSFLFKKVRRKVGRKLSKRSMTSELDYKEFLHDLEDEAKDDKLPLKQFYFISGQIISALSVEEICDKIDDIFKSVERLCSATSTIRQKKKPEMPKVVQCSISESDILDLSFDDTRDSEREKCDEDDIDRYIDEAFEQLNSTIANVTGDNFDCDDQSRESVTTLVRKFSRILKSPAVNCSPRRQRRCNSKFRDLAEFWQNKVLEGNCN
ncbi:uncharacterized protein LOC126367839 [Pectinophora gossypiella]|uniref:uncharacterized protein LOC126367839 n=1 Tax=Pectinophora gossypiella TaxID=13191 RepID=UPI00214F3EE6|nr:uncharacterized protein LOC126367839 [Pectinophora gossypiella]